MRKEIKDLVAGKSLGFMAKVSEMLDVKAASEFEIQKMKVAKTIVKEETELTEDEHHFEVQDHKSGKNSVISVKHKDKKTALKTAQSDSRFKVVGTFKNKEKADARRKELEGK